MVLSKIVRLMDFLKKDPSHLSIVYAMTGLQDHKFVENNIESIVRGKIVEIIIHKLDDEEPYESFKTLVDAYMKSGLDQLAHEVDQAMDSLLNKKK